MTNEDGKTLYRLDGIGFMVVAATTARKARKAGTREWGRGGTVSVRRATEDDVRSYRVYGGVISDDGTD